MTINFLSSLPTINPEIHQEFLTLKDKIRRAHHLKASLNLPKTMRKLLDIDLENFFRITDEFYCIESKASAQQNGEITLEAFQSLIQQWNQLIKKLYFVFLDDKENGYEDEFYQALTANLFFPLHRLPQTTHAGLRKLFAPMSALSENHGLHAMLVGSQFAKLRAHVLSYTMLPLENAEERDLDIRFNPGSQANAFIAVKETLKDFECDFKETSFYVSTKITISDQVFDISCTANPMPATDIDGQLFLTGPHCGKIRSDNPYLLSSVGNNRIMSPYLQVLHENYQARQYSDEIFWGSYANRLAYVIKLVMQNWLENLYLYPAHNDQFKTLLENSALAELALTAFRIKYCDDEGLLYDISLDDFFGQYHRFPLALRDNLQSKWRRITHGELAVETIATTASEPDSHLHAEKVAKGMQERAARQERAIKKLELSRARWELLQKEKQESSVTVRPQVARKPAKIRENPRFVRSLLFGKAFQMSFTSKKSEKNKNAY